MFYFHHLMKQVMLVITRVNECGKICFLSSVNIKSYELISTLIIKS